MSAVTVLSPSQTPGPLFGFALMFDGSEHAVDPGDPEAVTVTGRLLDGAGEPVAYPDGMVELWQRAQFARTRTDADGRWTVVAAKPSGLPALDGRPQAPHFHVAAFARGLLKQAQTRMYFPDEEAANAADPVLERVDPARRATLVARAVGAELHFDIHLQGPDETVFFAI